MLFIKTWSYANIHLRSFKWNFRSSKWYFLNRINLYHMEWRLNRAYPIFRMKNECSLNILGLGSYNRSSWNIWNTLVLIIFPLFKIIHTITKIITYIKITQVSDIESNINFIGIVINSFKNFVWVVPFWM